MDSKITHAFVQEEWKQSIYQTVCDYIRIPNQSPQFDPNWATNGLLDDAVSLLTKWVDEQKVEGLSYRVLKDAGRTPLIFIEVEGADKTSETVLLYGHLDKQPPMTETWAPGLHPFEPVLREGKLYGRGGADDGYSIFAAVSAIKAVKHQQLPHARCVVLIEACEESGSPDLPYYVNKLLPEIGSPSLVICLDSGCGNYEQFWLTTSLRGLAVCDLTVKILNEGVHSGHASGIVPSSFRIIRNLLNRVEDPLTGRLIDPLHVVIPDKQLQYAKDYADTVGHEVVSEFPFVEHGTPVSDDIKELTLNRTWRPTLSVTGVEGIPALEKAGNVLRTHTTLRLSIRLPPTLNPQTAVAAIKEAVEQKPPYGATVTCTFSKASQGWTAPELDDWLESSVNSASSSYFGKPARFLGEGGSIPFMGMLSEKFPGTQFVITGVLGPKSNAHGPNEFLHIEMAEKVTCCVASIIADHYRVKVPGAASKRRKVDHH